MKIPFRLGKRQSAGARSSAAEAVAAPGAVSLRSQMVLLMVAGAVLVVVPAVVVYLHAALALRAGEREQTQLSAKLFADSVRQWVVQQGSIADRVSADPKLVRLMLDADKQARDARAAALRGLFPGASRVSLLPPGLNQTDPSANPPISYALLDMLRHAETQKTAPPVEVHQSGTPRQHVNLVRRIVYPGRQRVVGDLVVSFPMQPLAALLKRGGVTGYVELQQQVAGATPVVLGKRGDARSRKGSPDSTLPIDGSRWRVVYWSSGGAGGSGLLFISAAGAAALAAAVLATLVWLVFRKLGSGLRHDQATVLTIAKDMRDGRARGGYTSNLAEMHDTIELMARAAAAGRATGAAAGSAGPARQPARPAQPAPAPAPAEPAPLPEAAAKASREVAPDDDALEISRVEAGENNLDPRIFRAYDIRGIVGEGLTVDVAFDIGRAIGSEADARGEQTVVVGRDGRLSSTELAEALVRGLLASGRDVKDVGEVPTPVLYFAASHLGTNSGVMVTGSHNPANYNGFKVVLGGDTLSTQAIDRLRQRIESDDMVSGIGKFEKADVVADYIDRVKSDVQLARSMKVVLDCGNGIAGAVAPELFKALGCEVIELFCDVDGNFPNHHPDPGRPENLAALIHTVREQGADLGIAFDGDGDRLGVVSAVGEIIWPDRLLMLLAADVLSRNPGAMIIYDVKSSRHVASVVAQHGGEALMSATGHSLIKSKMKETGALLAGEMSGHIFFKERWFGFDDGLYSAARLLEVLANEPNSPGEAFAALPDSMSTPEINVPMGEGEPAAFMEKLLKGAHFENARVETIDGLRVEFDRGWGLVRASNTTPCLVLRFEADDELALSAIQDEFRRVMLQVAPGLALPF